MITKRKTKLKKYQKINFTDIKSPLCDNKDISNAFIDDFLRISGFEIDDEGYLIDYDEDVFDAQYIVVKNKVLRHTVSGVLHDTDMIFDPYNNCLIIEELFKRYILEYHPQISSFQIFNAKKDTPPGINTYGYMTALYENGAQIITDNHWKDSTKFLDLWYRLESHDEKTIREIFKIYDDYENSVFLPDDKKR